MVAKDLKRWRSKPFKQEAFEFSTDPELEAKIRDVVDRYLIPPGEGGGAVHPRKKPDASPDRTAPS